MAERAFIYLISEGCEVKFNSKSPMAGRKQKSIFLRCVFCLLYFSPLSVLAGDGSGKITQVMAHAGDVVFFSLDGQHTNAPACSTGPWALSLTSNSGRAMYALILSAQAQAKKINVHGTGDCSAWSDRETAHHIWMDN